MSATSIQEEVPVEPTEAKRDVGSSQRYLSFELADAPALSTMPDNAVNA